MYQDPATDLAWSCPPCYELPGACGYGDQMVMVKNEPRCLPCDTRNVLDALNRIFAPTQPELCGDLLNLNETMCAKGFYDDASLCIPCQTTEVACPKGFFPKKCMKQVDAPVGCAPVATTDAPVATGLRWHAGSDVQSVPPAPQQQDAERRGVFVQGSSARYAGVHLGAP